MQFARFYGHFAAAYGTIWLAMMFVAVAGQTHVNAGEFGLYGFPVIAALYACIRLASDSSPAQSSGSQAAEVRALRRRLDRMEQGTDPESY